VVHDHWKPYFGGEVLSDNEHVLCNAHHLRELKAVSEIDKEPWAARLSRVLLKGLRLKHQHEGVVPALWAKRLECCYDRILKNALDWHASQPAFGAKHAKRPGHNLALRLQARKAETLRFMFQASVPFTNNLAEQALRMMKVKQKISGGFRTMQGAEVFASIRSFFSTVNKNSFNLLEAIRNPNAFCQFKWPKAA
jgi:transposase